MDITVGELQQMAGFWNESIVQKRKSESSMGMGIGIILFSLTIIGLFSMGTHASLFHTFVPSLFVFFGAFKVFTGAAADKKSKAALNKIKIFGEDKEEILEKILEEMSKFSGEYENSFFFMEPVGRTHNNQTILRWKGIFNGDMVTLIKEPKDEIYFLLIDELNIEIGKKVAHRARYMQLDKRLGREAALRGEGEGFGTIRSIEQDTSNYDHYAKVFFADREVKCEISVSSIAKYEKWKKGGYPQTTENGEPFPIWTLADKKKRTVRSAEENVQKSGDF